MQKTIEIPLCWLQWRLCIWWCRHAWWMLRGQWSKRRKILGITGWRRLTGTSMWVVNEVCWRWHVRAAAAGGRLTTTMIMVMMTRSAMRRRRHIISSRWRLRRCSLSFTSSTTQHSLHLQPYLHLCRGIITQQYKNLITISSRQMLLN